MKSQFLKVVLIGLTILLIVLINSCFSNKMTDRVYIANLMFMKGHLVVGDKLRTEGSPDLASRHLRHPIEEQYFLIEREIVERGDRPFDKELKEMYKIFNVYPSDGRIDRNYKIIISTINDSVKKLLTKHDDSREIILPVVSQLLNQASIEYQNSITKDIINSSADMQKYKLAERPEYEDSWGFITVAKSLIEESKDKHQDYLKLLNAMENLFEILPSPNPPSQLNDPQKFAKKVASIQKQYLSQYAISSESITY